MRLCGCVCFSVLLLISYAVASLFFLCRRLCNRICVVLHFFSPHFFGTVFTVFGLALDNLCVVSMFVIMLIL